MTRLGTGMLMLTGTSIQSGDITISKGALKLDFSATIQVADLRGITSPLVLSGGTLNLTGKVGTVDSQTVASLSVNAGASAVTLNGNSSSSLQLVLNEITRSEGGVFDFTLPAGVQDASNGFITSSTNDISGILGPWAALESSDFATLSSGNIIACNGYADVCRLNSASMVIANGATTNVPISEGSGSAADVTLGAAMPTISALTQSTNAGVSNAIINSAGQTLVVNGVLFS